MIDRSVEAVCFDLDDTLFAYVQYVRAGLLAAADRIAARTGDRLHDEVLKLYFDEDVTEGTFDRLAERHGFDAALVPELVEAYHAHEASLVPYPEAEAVLSRLARTFDLGLLTDGRNGREKLDRLGLSGFFDAVLVTHDRAFGKPDVEAFERIAGLLDAEPAAVVYVGDDPRTDFRGANRLGMATVRLRRGRHADRDPPEGASPDVVVADLSELPSLLGLVA